MKKLINRLLAFSLLPGLALMGSLLGGCQSNTKKELNILTWENYVPNEVVAQFESDTGIKVNYSNFSTNDEMLTKLRAAKGGDYDIVICSDFIIELMANEGGLIQELDKSKIPNYGNIDPNFQGKYYDPDNKYTIPYAAGAAILVYNTAKVPFAIESYDDLWRPELKDSVVLLDDPRDVLGLTLKTLGYSINETDPAHLQEAGDKLMKLKPNIIGFNADTPHEMMISGDASVGYMYGSQATAAMDAVDTITYVYPKEGLTYAVDNIVVPAKAPHSGNAYTFINYVLDGKNSAQISSIINYINCNTAAKEFLPQEYLDNMTVNIPAEVLAKSEVMRDVGDASKQYNDIWAQLKSQ